MPEPKIKGRGAGLVRREREFGGIDGICEKLAEGQPIRAIAKELQVSHANLAYYLNRPENEDAYRAALSLKADIFMEEVFDIIDDENLGVYYDDNGNERIDTGAVNRARLRAENRRFLAGKLDPSKYGDDKSDVNVTVSLSDLHTNALRARKAKTIDGN